MDICGLEGGTRVECPQLAKRARIAVDGAPPVAALEARMCRVGAETDGHGPHDFMAGAEAVASSKLEPIGGLRPPIQVRRTDTRFARDMGAFNEVPEAAPINLGEFTQSGF